MADKLRTVADAENRDAHVKNGLVAARRALGQYTGGPAGKNDAGRSKPSYLLRGNGAGIDLAVDTEIANPARYQLIVLPSEVHY
ncbi:hypothetical protein SDC9_84045 [bioreactor metagenome]|uniref:Uncharacterized protein n=1 Tax=bioreactor metagenome TaxID=1076179 RepID=A0A644ZAW0_9ZZZZ